MRNETAFIFAIGLIVVLGAAALTAFGRYMKRQRLDLQNKWDAQEKAIKAKQESQP